MGESGLTAWAKSTTAWSEPLRAQLGFEINMACKIDKRRLPDGMAILTYISSGVEGRRRIGAGSISVVGRGSVRYRNWGRSSGESLFCRCIRSLHILSSWT